MTQTRRQTGAVLTTLFVFLGAALMFGVEPLIGRLLLPYFGSSAHVWLTSMVVFQGVLLAGYAWSHFVAPRIGAWHLGFLAIPVAVLPLNLVATPSAEAPILTVLLAVVRAVGLPFLALSTVTVVAQWWWSRSELGESAQPYPLYAASNAGSLIALLAYPLVVEPLIGLTVQRWLWSIGYLGLIGVGVASWWVLAPNLSPFKLSSTLAEDSPSPSPPAVTWTDRAWWLILSALPSAFLLATTNVIAAEVGSFPLVWVVPLALYLGSFMLVFREGAGVFRWINPAWPEIYSIAIVIYLLGVFSLAQVGLHALVLLLVAILLHGELYQRRPSPARLTEYYLWISLGGFLGGMVVSFGPPLLFRGNWEYPIVLTLVLLNTVVLRGRSTASDFLRFPLWLFGGRMLIVLSSLSFAAFGAWFFTQILLKDRDQYRSFYGVFRVQDLENKEAGVQVRNIYNGATLHGSQILNSDRSLEPIAYYHRTQCIADAFALVPSPRRIGIIGLGAGALAAYSRPGDSLDFFEIDPENENLARRWFTWLERSQVSPKVYVGDGRLLLSRSAATYDYLQVDAFSGDGIPVHLLGVEALRVYRERLSEKGILLLHISNRYYDLRPVLKATAQVDGWFGVFDGPRKVVDPLSKSAMCVVLARDPSQLQGFLDLGWRSFGPADGLPDVEPWTDDYVNMVEALMRGRPAVIANPHETQ